MTSVNKEITISESNPDGCDHRLDDFHDICYKQVLIDNVAYSINDFVLVEPPRRKSFVGRLVCIFISEQLSFQAIVEKFVFATNLKRLFESQQYQYDENEIVRDLDFCKINLAHISKRCSLVLLREDEDPFYLKNNEFDMNCYYFCRFFLKSNRLVPFTELIKTPLPIEKPNANHKDESVTPSRKVSVKRNLNSSFMDTDYSIIKSEETESLKIRLRKSSKANSHVHSPPLRKSTRNIVRKSYADYVSPKKPINDDYESVSTPKRYTRSREVRPPKRYDSDTRYDRHAKSITIRGSSSEDDEYLSKKTINSASHSTHRTPIVIASSEDDSLPSKTRIRKRAVMKNKETPHGRESDSSDDDEHNGPRTHAQSTPKKRTRIEENGSDSSSPSERLNSSQESGILKVNLQNLRLSDSPWKLDQTTQGGHATPNKIATPKVTQRSTRRSASTKAASNDLTSDESDSTPEKVPRTPSRKVAKKPVSSCKTPKTPRSKLKLIKEGVITPSMQSRGHAVKKDDTPLMKARSQLHVSHIPKSLPCREKEYQNVYSFLEGKLLDECGGCMYISGVPGTGKTATVTSVIDHLKGRKGLPDFTFIDINAMKLSEPRQVYVEILKQLTGKMIHWEQAQHQLESIFIKPKSQRKPVVILIDELDILCTKRQEIVYNLLDWPEKAKNQLIVITIANTMDLPERLLMNRVASRLGLTRLTFQAYTFKQLEDIVTKRLQGTNSFNPDAVQLVARKVASVSGDARRALDICRRAAEIAETENGYQLVTIQHVNEAVNSMLTQPKVQAVKHCSKLEKLLLQAMVAEVERTGVEETNFPDVYRMFTSLSAIESFRLVPTSVALAAMFRLNSSRLVLIDLKSNDIYQRLILNISADDVYYALKENV